MNERKVKEELKNRIMKTEWRWITPSKLNELLDQGVSVIKSNLEEGNIDNVTERVINTVAFKLVDQFY